MWKEVVKDMKMSLALEYRRQKRKSRTPDGCRDSSCHVFKIKRIYFRQTSGWSQKRA